MKCRACWADKAFVRQVQGWRLLLHKCFVLTPLNLPFLAGVSVSTAIPVALLTWVVMPGVTRALYGWLYA